MSQSTNEAEGPTLLHVRKGEYLISIPDTGKLASVFKDDHKLFRRQELCGKQYSATGSLVYYDLYPYHIKLWPIPDKDYVLRLEYA